MKTYGLLGKSLTHSFSKKYFSDKFSKLGIDDCQYINLEIESIEDLPKILNQENLTGFNVTIPYKIEIIPYLDELDEVASKVGAVNTVSIEQRNGKKHLKGYNTDAFGFHQMIKPFLLSHHEHALILGTGGASKSVEYVLKQYGIDVRFATRQATKENQLNWKDINENVIHYHQLIVNTTPLGMFPDVDQKPDLPYLAATKDHLLIDLIYNPSETEFMRLGKSQGAVVLNGQTMLQQQAEKAWEIWND